MRNCGLRNTFAILGQFAVEGNVVPWVANHRKHRQFSDRDGDPHSPHAGYGEGFVEGLRGLWHAHTGWLFDKDATGDPHRYAKDLLDDRGLRIIGNLFVPIVLLSLAIPAVVWMGIARWHLRLRRRPGVGRRGSHLASAPCHLVDQLNLPLLGTTPLRLARPVAQRVVVVLAVVRRVLAQQPPRVSVVGVPWATPIGARSRRPGDPRARGCGLAWRVVRIPPERQQAKLAEA